MINGIRVESLRTFLCVAEEKSFSKAAVVMGVTQPAVSQMMAQIEKNLGAQLFYRHAGRVSLTPEGEAMLVHARRALQELENGEELVQQMQNMRAGRLTIAASDTISRFILLPVLKKYHEQFPEVCLKVINGRSSETVDKVREGTADLGFLNMPVSEQGVEIRAICPLHDIFVTSDRALAAKAMDASEIAAQCLMFIEKGSVSREYVENHFRKAGVVLTPRIELESQELVADFAASGIGVGCVIREFVQKQLKEETLFEIPMSEPVPVRCIGTVQREVLPLSKTAETFMSMIREEWESSM